eukprot:CAMPEP_0195122750 /NCGR_PEP_ID=MMETSP0448-20130528/127187_1 /TAXON_ID=66468 /ORGANISM="Heterocapsa triquestra, Strain CCMP 448" /LENGTH=50 /DNA_ID=CAMNT_0040160259 /DNA_START=14 /DNA_END=163 /DNA_ORIENTATION=+
MEGAVLRLQEACDGVDEGALREAIIMASQAGVSTEAILKARSRQQALCAE